MSLSEPNEEGRLPFNFLYTNIVYIMAIVKSKL